ncbi:hypothetical protein ACQPXH_31270 [Nocardia sp. CA-135953]|uniref:hypothetical protein n=1 Tax=Nocardia sp. CA-135953 TaxID=3239978 RepID=UPI003D99E2C6
MGIKLVTAVVGMAMLVLTGCAASSEPPNGVGEDCTATFELAANPQPLGSPARLEQTVRTKAAAPDTVSLRDLTVEAGWNDDWDRMVVVQSGMTRETMNSASGLAGYCWRRLPVFSSDDHFHYEYYVFIQGSAPKQAVPATPSRKLFSNVQRGDVLRPDTLLESVPPAGARQAGYFVPAG